jgi:D-sedoheptulose 7-phosphate isomerase
MESKTMATNSTSPSADPSARNHDKGEGGTSVARYFADVAVAVRALDVDQIEAVLDALLDACRRGATVYTLGNGGSAALASHMACDLGKNTAPDLGTGPDAPAQLRLRIVALTDNSALLTALGNDINYSEVFVEQLKSLLRPGDAVVAISGSGSSPNVVRALRYARSAGATTIGLTSTRTSASAMLDLTDVPVVVHSEVMEQIEDLHTVVNHVLAVHLRERIAAEVAG